MRIALTFVLSAWIVISSNAQLLCFYCDDCESSSVAVEACGLNSPIITTNVPEESTTATSPMTSTTQPPVTTAITSDGPILTPPTFPTQTSLGGGMVTPPITPMWAFEKQRGRLVISLPPPDQTPYVCSMVKFTDGQREVIRRGCAPLGQNSDETCTNLSGNSGHTRCAVCMTHLCNSGI
ncbi:uncharacterized protein LOC131430137 [Malaya genurostris]|uniref:uncharacterized protein LOC131430137 n=1 Tax=Malaya genurostris TaxID=325434 RepID=UPI0026F3B71F|nr:uncharacterized protein LOC131430137 [Malaya genurostris]